MASTLVQLGIIVASVLGLWLGARLLVDSAVRLARGFGLSELTIGLTVVAAGTSAPELVVTAAAASNGLGDLAVSNVFGSSIYNLAFVLGVVALVRVVPIADSLVRRDGLVLLVSTLLAGAAVADGVVSRLEGGLLVVGFVGYTAYLLRTGRSVDAASATPATGSGGDAGVTNDSPGADTPDVAAAVTREATDLGIPGRDVVLLVVGLAVILASGDAMVGAASALARDAGISEWVIGGTIVAAGTSTPEFAVSMVAIRRGSLGVSVGNLLGSNVFNLVVIMGVGAVIRPLSVSGAAIETFAWLLAVSVVMVAALWSGRGLSRLEGALFAGSELVRWALGLLG